MTNHFNGLTPAEAERLALLLEEMGEAQQATAAEDAIKALLNDTIDLTVEVQKTAPFTVRPTPAPLQRRASSVPTAASGANGRLPPGERATLIACAQHGSCVREQLSILTGYKRSSRDAYVARLREKGYVEADGERVVATQEGVNALGNDYQPLPTGEDLQRYWLDRLPPGEKAVLEVALKAYPDAVARDAIDEVTGYKRSSRDAYIARLSARQIIQAARGEIRAAQELFG